MFHPCTPGQKIAQVWFFITDILVRQGSRRCLHGDAGANTDDAGDNTDDPWAMTRGGPCCDHEWVKAPLKNLKNVHLSKKTVAVVLRAGKTRIKNRDDPWCNPWMCESPFWQLWALIIHRWNTLFSQITNLLWEIRYFEIFITICYFSFPPNPCLFLFYSPSTCLLFRNSFRLPAANRFSISSKMSRSCF